LTEPAGTPATVEFPTRIAAFARSLLGLPVQ
jgi:hypothetical protein